MYELKVENMSCGHCAARITQAVKTLDPEARVDVDIPSKQVRIESECEQADIAEALSEAGYPGVPIAGCH